MGCIWDLRSRIIQPDPQKLLSAIHLINNVQLSHQISHPDWAHIIGKITWILVVHRPWLAVFKSVFKLFSPCITHDVKHVSPQAKRELFLLSSLPPLASLELLLPVSRLCVAFDASKTAGAVMYTFVSPAVSQAWFEASRKWSPPSQGSTNQLFPSPIGDLKRHLNELHWKTAFSHVWRSQEHINGLEAATAVLALIWIAQKGIRNKRMIILTDSTVVLGALQKGRSSSIPLLVRCRKFSALSLMYNIRPCLLHVPSALNPADKPYRAH